MGGRMNRRRSSAGDQKLEEVRDNLDAIASSLEEKSPNPYKKPEGPALGLDDFDVVEDPEYRSYNLNKKGSPKDWAGAFTHRPATIYVPDIKKFVELPEFITMDMPNLEKKYQGRGIGTEMYKKIEQDTGKKILPDYTLSPSSSALHAKKGMGKEFGKPEYYKDIVSSLKNSLDKMGVESSEEAAERAYQWLKMSVEKKIPGFRSLAPLLAKGAAAGATGGLSLLAEAASEAADADEVGESYSSEAAMLRERKEKDSKEAVDKLLGKGTYDKASLNRVSPEDLLKDLNLQRFKKVRSTLR